MSYPNLIRYVRGIWNESSGHVASDAEVVDALHRIPSEALVAAERALDLFGPDLSEQMGYYNLTPREVDSEDDLAALLAVGEEVSK